MNRPFLLLLLFLSACSSMDLDDEWRPLTEIRESRAVAVGLSDSGARTIGRTIYVNDLDEFLDRHPEPLFSAVLHHERVHAIRQAEEGLAEWISRYLVDRDFMWEEEQVGWYAQLIYMRNHGLQIIPEAVANVLHGYSNAEGTMVGFAEALQWVQDVLAGRWEPPQ